MQSKQHDVTTTSDIGVTRRQMIRTTGVGFALAATGIGLPAASTTVAAASTAPGIELRRRYGDAAEVDGESISSFVELSDGSYVLLGAYDQRSVPGSLVDMYLLNVAKDGTPEPFQLYTNPFVVPGSVFSFPRDLAQTPDGGFMIIGAYSRVSVNGVWLRRINADGSERWIRKETLTTTYDGRVINPYDADEIHSLGGDLYALVKHQRGQLGGLSVTLVDGAGDLVDGQDPRPHVYNLGHELSTPSDVAHVGGSLSALLPTDDGGMLIIGSTAGGGPLGTQFYVAKTKPVSQISRPTTVDTSGNVVPDVAMEEPPTANLAWSAYYPAADGNDARGIAPVTDGSGFFVVGSWAGVGSRLVRIDTDGSLVWSKGWATPSGVLGSAGGVVGTSDGGFVVKGLGNDWVAKFTGAGDFEWLVRFAPDDGSYGVNTVVKPFYLTVDEKIAVVGHVTLVSGFGDLIFLGRTGPVGPTTPPDTTAPAVSSVSLTESAVAVGATTTLTAAVTDNATDDSGVNLVEYSTDGGATWTPMTPDDGGFDSGIETATATLGPYAAPGVVDVLVRVTDAEGNQTTSTPLSLIVFEPDTTDPVVSSVSLTQNPFAVNTASTLTATLTDNAVNDTGVDLVEYSTDGGTTWTAMTPDDGGFDGGVETATATLGPYTTPGVFETTIRVTDGAGNQTVSDPLMFAVYDPEGGFVTGGGWIESPPGAYPADPTLTGKATFGFVSKYKKGANVPTGNTAFQFKAADLKFKSTAYEWLVVAGRMAQFKGEGTIEGRTGTFGFMLTARDEGAGKNSGDTFRVKIVDKGTDEVVYDNGGDTQLGGGSIIIHQ